VTGVNLTSIVVAVVGAIIVILVYDSLGGRRRCSTVAADPRTRPRGVPLETA